MQENKSIYLRSKVADYYGGAQDLQLPERYLLEKYHGALSGKSVLDLGCGGGRTTKYLLEYAGNYVGVDYSEAMIAVCKSRYPEASFMVADARDLSRFESGAFDFVLFSFNGIDYMDHHGRIETLSEIRRVLKPGGVFVFSTHNRRFEREAKEPQITVSANPLVLLKRAVRYVQGVQNRARMREQEVEMDEYALVNDSAFNFSLLTYYVDQSTQRRQLSTSGFTPLEIVGCDGRELGASNDGLNSPWLYYACKN